MNIKKLNKKHNYVPMDCPCCDEFSFTSPTKLSIELDGEDETYDEFLNTHCLICGWYYDLEQTKNPDLKNGKNHDSLNEHKEWFKQKRLENPEYTYWEENMPPDEPIMCPVCGKYEFKDNGDFDYCPFCGWTNDIVQNEDPDCEGGGNTLSLNQFKVQYEQKIKDNPNYNHQEELDKLFKDLKI